MNYEHMPMPPNHDRYVSLATQFGRFVTRHWARNDWTAASEYFRQVVDSRAKLRYATVGSSLDAPSDLVRFLQRLSWETNQHMPSFSDCMHTAEFLKLLYVELTSREFASLPTLAAEVLQGQTVLFPSDAQRKQRYIERQREQEAKEREREAQRRKKDAEKRAAQTRERQLQQERERTVNDANRRLNEIHRLQGHLAECRDKLATHMKSFADKVARRLGDDYVDLDHHASQRWRTLTEITHNYNAARVAFVRQWVSEYAGMSLDAEQATAVGAVNGNVLVTARAGSGKTRVLTARALFLHKHCGVPVHRIMLLAFNRRAASEMESRLREWLGDDIPHVMTFHALAYALVHPSEKLLFDDKDEGKQHLSEVTQQVIDEHVRNPDFVDRIRNLMLEHFKADWSRIETGGYHLSSNEFLDHRYSLQHETLRGDRVSSFGQKVIANLLTEHDVPYWFKRTIRWGGRRLQADFSIPRGPQPNLYIRFTDATHSDDDAPWKKLADAVKTGKFKGVLLEYGPNDLQALGNAGFAERLCDDLREHGLKPRRLDADELWKAVRDRALDSFAQAMVNFVGRCRQRAWSLEELDHYAIQRKMNENASDYEIEFYRIGRRVYEAYLARLDRDELEDFNGLMLKAAERVKGGTTRFERKGNAGDIRDIDYLHIDEYQDFSRSFYELTSTMREANPDMTVFAVGDDWQAINGFAGSDLAYFHNFDEHFPKAQHLSITQNYRSQKKIVNASNALLAAEDELAEAVNKDDGLVEVCNLDKFVPTPLEREALRERKRSSSSGADEHEIAVARIAQWLAQEGEVTLLNRTRDLDALPGRTPKAAQVALRESMIEELREHIIVDTAHSYKGLECDSVVILDAVANHYPLIHPHWIFGQIFGDSLASIEAAELRLFYVAVSRARQRLIICTQHAKRSPFLDMVQKACSFPTLDVAALEPIAREASDRFEVRVFDSLAVKDQLNHDGFNFVYHADWSRCYWSRVMPKEEVNNDWITKAPWNNGSVRIEVYDDKDNLVPSFDDNDNAANLAQADPF